MIDVVAHLRACATDFDERACNPRVAWDSLGAAAWAGVCTRLAGEIAELGLDHDAAVAHLKTCAARMRGRADGGGSGGWGMVITMDAWTRMDEIIDPVARDRMGWIELIGHREHFGRHALEGLPTYRRLLGRNRCVAVLTREHRVLNRRGGDGIDEVVVEDGAAWEARRAAWLGRYHPAVPVVHAEGGWERSGDGGAHPYSPLMGTVGVHAASPMATAFVGPYGAMCDMPARTAAEAA